MERSSGGLPSGDQVSVCVCGGGGGDDDDDDDDDYHDDQGDGVHDNDKDSK